VSWINKRNVAVTAGVLGALALFLWLAFDPLLKRALIGAGQAAAGAKVEIDRLDARLLAGRLDIGGIAVADKTEPMKNLFELEQATFQLSPGQALRGKAVIPLAGLKGFRFGTPRKTSGALPLSKPSRLERLVAEQLAPVKENLSADLSKAKAKAVELDPRKLESLKGLDAAQQKLGQVGDDLKQKVGADSVEAQIKELEGQIKQLQSGGGSPADVARKVQLAADAQKKIKALLAQVEASRAAVRDQIGGVQSQLKRAQELRDKDVNGLLAEAGLPAIDAESLTKRLLGPATSAKISKTLYWVSWARKRAAAQPAKAPPPARRRGVDFEFPRADSYPQFLLQKAELTGRVDALFQGKDMDLSGSLEDVASDPAHYGKPARLQLRGAVPAGPTMRLSGQLDPRAAELSLQYAGLPLSGLALGDDSLGATLQKGSGRLNGTIRIVGEEWNGNVLLQADGVSLQPKVALAGPAAGFAAQALSGIGRFTVSVGISGREDDLRFKVSSDLGQAVADGMKKAFSGELAKQRQRLQQQVDALYAGRAAELQSKTSALQAQMLAPLDKQKAALEDQLKRAVSKGLGGIKLWR
jgi:uncharacterized protein (TIGR03545 family)